MWICATEPKCLIFSLKYTELRFIEQNKPIVDSGKNSLVFVCISYKPLFFREEGDLEKRQTSPKTVRSFTLRQKKKKKKKKVSTQVPHTLALMRGIFCPKSRAV